MIGTFLVVLFICQIILSHTHLSLSAQSLGIYCSDVIGFLIIFTFYINNFLQKKYRLFCFNLILILLFEFCFELIQIKSIVILYCRILVCNTVRLKLWHILKTDILSQCTPPPTHLQYPSPNEGNVTLIFACMCIWLQC